MGEVGRRALVHKRAHATSEPHRSHEMVESRLYPQIRFVIRYDPFENDRRYYLSPADCQDD
jgi:hypothetical protein